MTEFDVSSLSENLVNLYEVAARWECLYLEGEVSEANLKSMTEYVDNLFVICLKAKWPSALTAIRTTRTWLHSGRCLYIAAVSEARHIGEAVSAEIGRYKFFSLEFGREHYFDRQSLFGGSVAVAFPSAAFDIREAGNCMATDRNTAAVFHLMRAVEWGLRALASDLGVRKIRASKKPGKRKYIPIAYSDWEHILDGLQNAADTKLNRLKRGTEKQKVQEFYYPALQDVKAIRDAWRNHVMHARSEYTQKDADAVFQHVKRLMTSLASRVKEA